MRRGEDRRGENNKGEERRDDEGRGGEGLGEQEGSREVRLGGQAVGSEERREDLLPFHLNHLLAVFLGRIAVSDLHL